ncbi:MAG: hypothetical protein WD059_05795 [Balneolaceae bacterium]
MVILHKINNDSKSAALQEELNRLVISYKTVEHNPEQEEGQWPFIEEDGKIIEGKRNIKDWLEELEDELKNQRSITGDGCYIDPKTGSVC